MPDIQQITVGSNSISCIKINAENEPESVVKQYGYETNLRPNLTRVGTEVWNEIMKDYLILREKLALSKTPIPELKKICLIDDCLSFSDSLSRMQPLANKSICFRLYIEEEYCGKNLIESLVKNQGNGEHYITNIRNIILNMPLDVELDIHPLYFTIHKDQIFFVDLMPPQTVKYQANKQIVGLFPTIERRSAERETRRRWRNTTVQGRLTKFDYYLSGLRDPAPNTPATNKNPKPAKA